MSIEDAARRFARGQPRRRAVAFRHTRRAPQAVAFSPAPQEEESMIREYDAPRGAGLGGCLANLALLVIIAAVGVLAAERVGLLGQPQTTIAPILPPTAIVRVIQSAPVAAPAAPRATEAPAVQQSSAPAPQEGAQAAPPRQLIVIKHEGNAPVVIDRGSKRRGRP